MHNRKVLRAGFAAMMGLLIVSAFQAYRIQQRASRQSAEIYHRYVQGEDILYRCRRGLFLGGIYARDFLLSKRPNRESTFRTQLAELKKESKKTLDELEALPGPAPSASPLTAKTQEYWDALESIADWTIDKSARQGLDFVEREITPRRNAVGDLARDFREAHRSALKSSEAEFARNRRSATLRLLLIVALCLALGGAVAYFSLTHFENLEQETARQYKQLEHLSTRLLEAQEDERRRLSRELHDEIGQTLTALGIEVSGAHTLWKTGAPGVEERLERARVLAEKAVQTVRDISLLLRPPLLDDLGLGEALQWHVEEFSRRTAILCDFCAECLQDTLPDAFKICVYRIVQEALHNCETHAAASKVRVSVRQTPQGLLLEIEDNGHGFAGDQEGARSHSNGLGIPGMKERATMLGGSLYVDSTAGGGTRVRLSLPVPQMPAAAAAIDREEVRA